MIRYFYVLIISTAFIGCNTKATVIDKDKERIDAVCDDFMQLFKEGKFEASMQLLKANSVLEPETIDTLQKEILEQVKGGAFSSYGEVISYEFVGERKVKKFAAKRYYALKFKKFFLKFVFNLYNSGRGWKIIGFKYDEEIAELY